MSTRFLRNTLAGAAIAAALASVPAGPARAGDVTPGKWYENKVVGFHFRPLENWATVPPGTDPNDPKVCGYYSDAAKFGHTSNKPQCDVYAFKQAVEGGTSTPGTGGEDKPPAKPKNDDEARAAAMDEFRYKSTRAVFDRAHDRYKGGMDQYLAKLDEKHKAKALRDYKGGEPVEREMKVGDQVIMTVESTLGVPMTDGRTEFLEGIVLVAGWTHNEEYEIGLFFEIPEAGWKKYSQGVYSSIRTLDFLEGTDVAAARKDLEDALAGKTGDERWLAEIKKKVGPGWAYFQTKNYLLVYDQAVKPDRVKTIAVQIEAIRKDVYEVLFPPDRPVTAISVVRICKDKVQYMSYGGPPSSAGYWMWEAQELVFYEDVGAKKDSLRVLNHEAFHQFIFYSVGSIAPHDWFNEGHGDFFAGFNFNSNGKFVPARFAWRQGEIKGAIGTKKYIPLQIFLQYTHEQYYGPLMGQNYAQGWSVIWFLRTQQNPEWKGLLETYFTTLKGEVSKWVNDEIAAKKAKNDGSYTDDWKPGKTPPDIEKSSQRNAYNAVFGSWDAKKWDRFEKEWKEYKY
jgi:hypothetical protein